MQNSLYIFHFGASRFRLFDANDLCLAFDFFSVFIFIILLKIYRFNRNVVDPYIYLGEWSRTEILLNPPSVHFSIFFFFRSGKKNKNYVFATATEKSHMPPMPCAIFTNSAWLFSWSSASYKQNRNI